MSSKPTSIFKPGQIPHVEGDKLLIKDSSDTGIFYCFSDDGLDPVIKPDSG
jgi:hypothetical protein